MEVNKQTDFLSLAIQSIEHEKPMLPPCNCRLKCNNTLTEEVRENVHRKYWDMKYSERRAWLLVSINQEEVKRRKVVIMP